MAVIDDDPKQQAKELWLEGKKYKEISDITGIKVSTIKSYVSRSWSKGKSQPMKKKVAVAKKVATNNDAPPIEELSTREIETLGNEELTEKQRLFCIYYSKTFNATSAYKKAYKSSYSTAMCEGSKLLRNPKIKDEIMLLKQDRYAREMLTTDDIFQKYMEIAFADITDFIAFGSEEVPVMGAYGPIEVKDPITGVNVPVMKKVNNVYFKDCTDVDGTLLGEVKQGKEGVSIKLPDRMKAMEWLSKHLEMGTEEEREKIRLLKAQTAKLEIGNDNTPDEGAKSQMDAITSIINQMQPPKDDQ